MFRTISTPADKKLVTTVGSSSAVPKNGFNLVFWINLIGQLNGIRSNATIAPSIVGLEKTYVKNVMH